MQFAFPNKLHVNLQQINNLFWDSFNGTVVLTNMLI